MIDPADTDIDVPSGPDDGCGLCGCKRFACDECGGSREMAVQSLRDEVAQLRAQAEQRAVRPRRSALAPKPRWETDGHFIEDKRDGVFLYVQTGPNVANNDDRRDVVMRLTAALNERLP